jgi:hypothetical protein
MTEKLDKLKDAIADAHRGHRITEYEDVALRLASAAENYIVETIVDSPPEEPESAVEKMAYWARRVIDNDGALSAGSSMDLDMAHDELTEAARSYLSGGQAKNTRAQALAGPNKALLDLSKWLDKWNAHKPLTTQHWERVGKVGEENGEVVAAMIGWGGQNPRKGRTNFDDDVVKELLDVAITALGAIVHLAGNKEDFDVLSLLADCLVSIDARRRGFEGYVADGMTKDNPNFNRAYDYVMLGDLMSERDV